MAGGRHQAAMLPGNRLHLNEGPIDLIIWADGAPEAVAAAYRAAERRFDGLLAELVAELPLLRMPVGSSSGEERYVRGPIARRMVEACGPYRSQFITPMAAVAGAVAEAVLGAMTAAAPLTRAYVNDGGDIALHLTPGTSLAIGVVRSLETAVPEGEVRISHGMGVRGIATSGWRGRSFSLGIADAVTVLAHDAPGADVAATLIANAVNIDDPAVRRQPAQALDPDSDLGDRLVTVDVGPLAPAQIAAALDAGVACAEDLRRSGLIAAALLALAGEWRSVGSPAAYLAGPK
ncbi:MAG TPA: UPF0280 family protein [Hyphomicrobiaceae bacterium]|nr:UPF0280 family protein [Hyphomicrobiaceae bacterium]